DLTAATALYDIRFLDGDAELYGKLEREVPRQFDRDPNAFVRRLTQEKQERHARFGDTVFLLEPNLKNGEGGYRDLLTGLWAAKRETDRLLERCVVEPRKKPTVRNLDHAFALWNGKLTTQDPETFRRRPSELMRIFNVALETGAEIYGHTRDLIAEAVENLGPQIREDREAGAQFVKLLIDDRDARSPSLLEQAHDLGLLAAIMPEFEPCTGRVQHDLY